MSDTQTNWLTELLSDDKGQLSSARAAFWIAVVVSTVMSCSAIYLEVEGELSLNYIFLTLSMWLIATLQKNWAKHIEKLKGA